MKTDKIVKHIIDWLNDYTDKANIKGYVVGVSGGIDSAVVASLCANTGKKVLLLEMPIHQAQSQVNRAQELIAQLKKNNPLVSDLRTDLTPVFETFKQVLEKTDQQDKVNLALANTRARLRMTTLYYYAGLHGFVVVGTGNKVEDFGVGFYTKYGDGGVDLSPIADLLKSEVYELGRFLNVPQNILQAAPTDGLFGDNRTDEDQLGASYDELEWAMAQVALDKKPDNFEGRQKKIMEIYIKLNKANQHKMLPIPICKIPETYRK